MQVRPRILIIGLFISPTNKHLIYRTAADQLAELLNKNGYTTIKSSIYVNQLLRFIDILKVILFSSNKYELAIVPIYGGRKNYLWIRVAQFLLKLLRKKSIVIIHGGSIPKRIKHHPKNYKKIFTSANAIVCPSNFIKEALEKELNLHSLLIENVINLHDYQWHPKSTFSPKLFWMRTFEDVYNPLMAVRVLAKLKERYPNASMIMAGHDRGMLQQTKQLVAELNMASDISFPGYISNELKNKYAQEFDFYICTNQIDNAPVTLIEMMAMGIPVVTVDSGGIPFIIKDGYNGMLVPYNDVDSMVQRIVSIIENPSLGKQLIENGKTFSMQYGEAAVIKKWEQLFQEL
jgi:glycosyltransferase involved in cell wall biosynthesis